MVKVPSQCLYRSPQVDGSCDGSSGGGSGTPGEQNVTWTNAVNVTVNGNSLQENCNGCGDAGAQSTQTINGDGYFEFTATEADTMREAGLSHGNTDNTYDDIDFGLLLWPSGIVEVRENGIYKGDHPYVAGDRFRVAEEGGVVKYYQNGTVFYTSLIAPTNPLLVDTAFYSIGSTITDAVIFGAQ